MLGETPLVGSQTRTPTQPRPVSTLFPCQHCKDSAGPCGQTPASGRQSEGQAEPANEESAPEKGLLSGCFSISVWPFECV